MNRKKILVGILACLLIAAIFFGVICFRQREHDPYWQAAKEICSVQTALQEADEDWALDSVSSVSPFHYQYSDGTVINYYCCISAHWNGEPTALNGLNEAAVAQVIDVNALENARGCEVNGQEAILGEHGGNTYLCWTISPKYSCVIEYPAGAVAEEDIFRMAESVGALEKNKNY